jgi:hypothetical protein
MQLVYIGGDFWDRKIGNTPILNSESNRGLTLGRIYEGEYSFSWGRSSDVMKQYSVVNDYGYLHYYPMFLFRALEEVREEKLNKILK